MVLKKIVSCATGKLLFHYLYLSVRCGVILSFDRQGPLYFSVFPELLSLLGTQLQCTERWIVCHMFCLIQTSQAFP